MSESVTAEHTIGAAVAKATPPLVSSGMYIMGYPVADWLVVVTLFYTILLTIKLISEWVRNRRTKHEC